MKTDDPGKMKRSGCREYGSTTDEPGFPPVSPRTSPRTKKVRLQAEEQDADSQSVQSHASVQSHVSPQDKRKAKLQLTHHDEIEVAAWFQEHPEFWLKTDEGYKDNKSKERMLDQLATKLRTKCTGDQLRTWLWSMRSTYGRLLRAGPSGSEKQNPTAKERWILEAFACLRDQIIRLPGRRLSVKKAPDSNADPNAPPNPSTSATPQPSSSWSSRHESDEDSTPRSREHQRRTLPELDEPEDSDINDKQILQIVCGGISLDVVTEYTLPTLDTEHLLIEKVRMNRLNLLDSELSCNLKFAISALDSLPSSMKKNAELLVDGEQKLLKLRAGQPNLRFIVFQDHKEIKLHQIIKVDRNLYVGDIHEAFFRGHICPHEVSCRKQAINSMSYNVDILVVCQELRITFACSDPLRTVVVP